MGNHSAISPLFSAFRRHLRSQRDARRARQALALELGQYNTEAERLELVTIMDRHTPQETAELRAIIGR